MENTLRTCSKFSFKLQSNSLRTISNFFKKHHALRWKTRLEKQLEQDLYRLSETSPHLIDDVGFVDVVYADTKQVNSSFEIDLSARG